MFPNLSTNFSHCQAGHSGRESAEQTWTTQDTFQKNGRGLGGMAVLYPARIALFTARSFYMLSVLR